MPGKRRFGVVCILTKERIFQVGPLFAGYPVIQISPAHILHENMKYTTSIPPFIRAFPPETAKFVCRDFKAGENGVTQAQEKYS